MLGLCFLCPTCTEWPKPTNHLSKVIAGWCYGDPTWCELPVICYLTASTHYSSGALIPECNGLSQFKQDTDRPFVPVRKINLMAYLRLVQPTENHPDLDLNAGLRRSSASQAQQALWLRKHISPLSHGDRHSAAVTVIWYFHVSLWQCSNCCCLLLLIGDSHRCCKWQQSAGVGVEGTVAGRQRWGADAWTSHLWTFTKNLVSDRNHSTQWLWMVRDEQTIHLHDVRL